MPEPQVLANWRKFPRARLSFEVIFRDGAHTWFSRTKDISLGGCRIAGYYPFALGKRLAVRIEDQPALPLEVQGEVAQLYGGTQNSFGLVFQADADAKSALRAWMADLLARYPEVKRTLAQTPAQLPLNGWFRKTALQSPGRPLSSGELAVLRWLDRSRPVSFCDLRHEWGDDWERKAQALFELIAGGIVAHSITPAALPAPPPPAPRPQLRGSSVRSMISEGQGLLRALEREFGPLDTRFAMELEEISREIFGSDLPAVPIGKAKKPNN